MLVAEKFNYTLHCQDAVEFLEQLPDESADLILTDPPYESLEKYRNIGTTTRLTISKGSSNPWFKIFPNNRFPQLLAQVYRVLKNNRHFYLFCDSETMFAIKPMAEAAGFKFWKPIVWDKCTIGMGYHYRARHEFILFFEKGKRRLNDLSIPDVLQFPRPRGGYPTRKPVELAEVLVNQSTRHLEWVIDPFMGSGAFGVASLSNQRFFKGNDISHDALLNAEVNIESLQNFQQSGSSIKACETQSNQITLQI